MMIFFSSILAGLSLHMAVSAQDQTSFYDFQVTDINGKTFDMASLKGRKVLVVNTASKCGFTPQYADLQRLYEEYSDRGLVIIGFPANNFLREEPGDNQEIKTFCQVNYGVTFPMMSKISVRGKDMHPLYKWLTRKELNGVMNSRVSWNFQKYLIDENGRIAGVVKPRVNPYSDKIINWLNGK